MSEIQFLYNPSNKIKLMAKIYNCSLYCDCNLIHSQNSHKSTVAIMVC